MTGQTFRNRLKEVFAAAREIEYKNILLGAASLLRLYGIFFIPSITLVVGGIYVFFEPKAFLYVVSAFLVTLGFVGVACTWKLLLLRKKVHEIMQRFDGKILLQGVKLQSLEELDLDLEVPNPKDQIIH